MNKRDLRNTEKHKKGRLKVYETIWFIYVCFLQTLYRYVLEDVYEFPTLEKDLKEFQKLLRRRQ